MIDISYSKLSTYLHCKRRYEWTYVKDLSHKGPTSVPLRVGDLTHQLLDLYFTGDLTTNVFKLMKGYLREAEPDQDEASHQQVALQSAGLINAYVQEFEDDDLKILSPEMHLEKEYTSPDGLDFRLYSRLDALALTTQDQVFRMEHKTTAKLDSFYLKGLNQGLQTGIALWLMEDLLPEKVYGTIFNLLVKTKIPYVKRSPVLKSKRQIQMTKETVHGIIRDIDRGDFYPSLDCIFYYRECDYLPLCKNDTEATRETFYESREEVKKRRISFKLRDYIKQQEETDKAST